MATAKKLPADYKIDLILDRREAEVLRKVLSNIGGDPIGYRSITSRINNALANAGVEKNEEVIFGSEMYIKN